MQHRPPTSLLHLSSQLPTSKFSATRSTAPMLAGVLGLTSTMRTPVSSGGSSPGSASCCCGARCCSAAACSLQMAPKDASCTGSASSSSQTTQSIPSSNLRPGSPGGRREGPPPADGPQPRQCSVLSAFGSAIAAATALPWASWVAEQRVRGELRRQGPPGRHGSIALLSDWFAEVVGGGKFHEQALKHAQQCPVAPPMRQQSFAATGSAVPSQSSSRPDLEISASGRPRHCRLRGATTCQRRRGVSSSGGRHQWNCRRRLRSQAASRGTYGSLGSAVPRVPAPCPANARLADQHGHIHGAGRRVRAGPSPRLAARRRRWVQRPPAVQRQLQQAAAAAR